MQNIDYFDDVVFRQVSRVVSRRDGAPSLRHEFWGLGIMLGNGFVKTSSVSGEQKILKMPFLYLIQPSQGGSFWGAVNGEERDNRWFIMQGSRAERIVKSMEKVLDRKSGKFIYLKSYQELIAIHQKMLHIFLRGIPSQHYQLAVCLEEFVGAICSAMTVTRQNSPVFDYVAKIAEIISADPGVAYDFPQLARDHRISFDHFRRCFHEYAGKPVYEFLLEKRLVLADSLLRESCCSIKEIAERCGFPRQAEFARFVKQRTGLTPSELRQKPDLDSE